MKKIAIVYLVIWLFGCASNTMDVKPVSNSYEITHVCIETNPKVKVNGFMEVIEDGFQEYGITTEVYTDELPERCEYKLTYTAFRKFIDWSPRLTHAELRLFKDNKRIGYAEYYMARKYAWFSYATTGTLKEKINPVIQELLKNHV